MEDHRDYNATGSAFHQNWLVRVLSILIAFGLFFAVAWSDIIVSAYWAKMLIACCSVGIIGFVIGFQPHLESRQTWKSFNVSLFYICATLIQPATHLAGMYRFPVESRGTMLLRAPFLVTCLLLFASIIAANFMGVALFRRMHPGTAVIPLTPEESEEPAGLSASERRTLLKYSLLVFALSIPAIASSVWFPKHVTTAMLSFAGLSGCLVSFLIGRRWEQYDRQSRRFWLLIAVLGLIAGFVGFFGGSKVHDTPHFLRALRFVGMIAAVFWFPAVIARTLPPRMQEGRE